MLSTPDAGLWVGGVAALRAALARWRRGQALILVYEAKSMGLKSRVRSPHNNRKYRRHFARREEQGYGGLCGACRGSWMYRFGASCIALEIQYTLERRTVPFDRSLSHL